MAKVLVVDDEPAVRDIIRLLLSREGHEVIEAEDGGSAYAKAVSQRPDIVLLDIGMPDMSGFLVLRELKHNPETESIPVIILTGSHRPQDERQGMQQGALDYVTKPWGTGELEDRVRIALIYVESQGHIRTPPQPCTGPGNRGNNPQDKAQDSSEFRFERARRLARGKPKRAGPNREEPSATREDEMSRDNKEGGNRRPSLEEAVRSFITQKYPRIQNIRLIRITESGPTRGLNVYKIEGITTVLLGDVPALQAKGFHITVYATKDGRVVDKQGNVM